MTQCSSNNRQQRVENFNSLFSSVFTHDSTAFPVRRDFSGYPLINDLIIQEQRVLDLLLNMDIKKNPSPHEILHAFLRDTDKFCFYFLPGNLTWCQMTSQSIFSYSITYIFIKVKTTTARNRN